MSLPISTECSNKQLTKYHNSWYHTNIRNQKYAASVIAIRERLTQVEERSRNWETAIDRGLNVEIAVGKLNLLVKEKEGLERQLNDAKNREHLEIDVEAVSQELMKCLTEFQDVLSSGSVAEVKLKKSGRISVVAGAGFEPATSGL